MAVNMVERVITALTSAFGADKVAAGLDPYPSSTVVSVTPISCIYDFDSFGARRARWVIEMEGGEYGAREYGDIVILFTKAVEAVFAMPEYVPETAEAQFDGDNVVISAEFIVTEAY